MSVARSARLKARLAAELAATGPIDVAAFMARCLHDPLGGYYARHVAIGERGDFVTAPAVSQMFGELIGLWFVEAWRRAGSPGAIVLAEAGPGRGELMEDALRAARLAPDFRAAVEIWLIETSAPLRAAQAERLSTARPRWAAALAEAPAGRPLYLVANEFLDCLPARQFVRRGAGWAERVVGVGAGGELTFGLRPAAIELPEAPEGAVVERSPVQAAFAQELAERITVDGGAALLIDYGDGDGGFGDTLQALAGHRRVDPLAAPGEADLTVHADFGGVMAAARSAGASAALLSQGALLRRLGVEKRAAALTRAHPDRADLIRRQLDRLIAPDQMGELFKAVAIWRGPAPPGFEAP